MTLRVLYSFPHRIGADRICLTAWQQVANVARLGARLLVYPGSVKRDLPTGVQVRPTLARGFLRVPVRVVGSLHAFEFHDGIAAHRLHALAGQIDVVHCWPLGALKTLQVARELGIPTLLERPNAHTRLAYALARRESERVGIELPPEHEHAHNAQRLAREEAEYRLATRLLCPSDFVRRSFLAEGFAPERLARHQYGYDPGVYRPLPAGAHGDEPPGAADGPDARGSATGLRALFAGGCAPRKGLHHALRAWIDSAASRDGRLRIAGDFVPGYREQLAPLLAHPSVEVLGHRRDLPALMQHSDVLLLPSVEEGSALVTYEARGSGCVLLVSDAAGAVCTDGVDALLHPAGDVGLLTAQLTALVSEPGLLQRLRAASLAGAGQLTWQAAGVRLLAVYAETVALHAAGLRPEAW